MSTMEIQTATMSPRPPSVFRRLISTITILLEVYAEAKEQADAAHQRYPFGRW